MESTAQDISFFLLKAGRELKGLIGTYVDNTQFADDSEFLKRSGNTSKRFEAKEREFDTTRFAGACIESKSGNNLVHQKSYSQRLEPLGLNTSFEEFCSERAQLTWMIHARPDIRASANKLAQVTAESLEVKHVCKFKETVKKVKSTANQLNRTEPR